MAAGPRAAPELLLVEAHHRVRDLHEDARARLDIGRLFLLPLVRGHGPPVSLPLQGQVTPKAGGGKNPKRRRQAYRSAAPLRACESGKERDTSRSSARRAARRPASGGNPGAPGFGVPSPANRSRTCRRGKESSVGRHRPSLGAIVLVGAVLGLGADPAWAGTYDVLACAAAPGGVNRSWTASSSSRYLAAYEQCPPSKGPDREG